MADVLMARTSLPSDVVDLGIGEPYVLQEFVAGVHDLSHTRFDVPRVWEYAPPSGFGPLVKALEDRYQAPVVVTTGAKQGLLAAFVALASRGKTNISCRAPYWPSFPHMSSRSGLKWVPSIWYHEPGTDACLLVHPNNPDGHAPAYSEAAALCAHLREEGVPVIHDAAYYTPSYIRPTYHLGPLGDMQVFSASKMFGLSGLRLGWVVCHNSSYVDDLTAYVEATTAGVSTASQRTLLALLEVEAALPSMSRVYEASMRDHLQWAHSCLTHLPEAVGVATTSSGMFGWIKTGVRFRPDQARVHVLDGAAFGYPGYARLNLAVPRETLLTGLRRLSLASRDDT